MQCIVMLRMMVSNEICAGKTFTIEHENVTATKRAYGCKLYQSSIQILNVHNYKCTWACEIGHAGIQKDQHYFKLSSLVTFYCILL